MDRKGECEDGSWKPMRRNPPRQQYGNQYHNRRAVKPPGSRGYVDAVLKNKPKCQGKAACPACKKL
jgi:hypothetical protein